MAVAPTDGAALVGRGGDLAALEAALEQARGGQPVTVLAGACVDLGESALPYAGVADALRGAPAAPRSVHGRHLT